MDGEHHARATFPDWWRWPLIPFASLLGGALGAALLTLVMWLGMKLHGGMSEDGWYFRYILPLFTTGLFAYLNAIIACHVAPRGKVIAGTVMATILVLITAFGTLMLWVDPNSSLGPSIQATVGAVAILVGSVIALVQAHDVEVANSAWR